jgi:hypothetical protein
VPCKPHSPFLYCGEPDCPQGVTLSDLDPPEGKMSLSSCSCDACQKYGIAGSSVISPDVPVGPIVGMLPVASCPSHVSWKADYCRNCQVMSIASIAVTSDPKWAVQNALDFSAKYLLSAALRTIVRNLTAQGNYEGSSIEALLDTIYADHDFQSELLASDLYCQECDAWVSNILPSHMDHWEDICGDCYLHTSSGNCDVCDDCGEHRNDGECSCCTVCGQKPGWCECCDYCSEAPGSCECEYCEDCGGMSNYCGCGETPYKFGSTKSVDWDQLPALDVPLELGGMGSLDLSVDPVRAAADYYLLDGIVNLVRFGQIDAPEAGMRRLQNKDEIVRNDGMLSAWVVAATRSRNRLIERLDQTFLNYAVSAVGGELRYHRACAGDWAPQSRSGAWQAFVGIVNEKGPEVVFNAVDLFEEFGSGSYGGTKWAQIAKVTALRLSGKMAPWLFVDRIFTLEHNGGCVLNKQSWATSNKLGYGLHHMRKVLDAHAAADTDWSLLLSVASPEVADMFKKVDSRISAQARRAGGFLPSIPSKAQKTVRQLERYCYNCGDYGCDCVQADAF